MVLATNFIWRGLVREFYSAKGSCIRQDIGQICAEHGNSEGRVKYRATCPAMFMCVGLPVKAMTSTAHTCRPHRALDGSEDDGMSSRIPE